MSHAEPIPLARRWKPAGGERLYAIGDVHGCAELLEDLLARIREDNAAREPAPTRLILLGDMIDRGPASRQVVDRLMRYTEASRRVVVLKGNHEQIMASSLRGDEKALTAWLHFGGAETLTSFGVPEVLVAAGASAELMACAQERVPKAVLTWMERLRLSYRSGDLLFVHAGLRPEVPLRRQDPLDMLWITEPFLDSEEVRPFLVVHGHHVVEDGLDIRPNRIGIDTGAYRTGRLSALGLQAGEAWRLST
jgi:serine/threonine protein phosphatase 1